MKHAVLTGSALITMVLCLGGCSGAASNQSPSDDPNSPAPGDDTETTTSDTETVDNHPEPVADTSVDKSDSCGGKICEEGQSCIEYYGVTGKPLYICGIPCKENARNDGCPENMTCHVIPDGPTQCVKR